MVSYLLKLRAQKIIVYNVPMVFFIVISFPGTYLFFFLLWVTVYTPA